MTTPLWKFEQLVTAVACGWFFNWQGDLLLVFNSDLSLAEPLLSYNLLTSAKA